jgi:hypothetical protein
VLSGVSLDIHLEAQGAEQLTSLTNRPFSGALIWGSVLEAGRRENNYYICAHCTAKDKYSNILQLHVCGVHIN